MSEWYKDWFDSDEYLDVYAHRDKTDVENLLNLIKNNIKLKKGAQVLDAACGAGRFSNLFAKEGFDVTSFDLSLQLLNIAKTQSIENKLNVKYLNSDIREVPLKGSFYLVLNMFTSFGYFNTDKENFSFICNANKLLDDDGIFIFDYLNINYVTNNLVPHSQKIVNNKTIVEERRINNHRVEKKITIDTLTDKKIFNESVQMYSREEIINGFKSCGFKVYKIFGDYIGSNFNDETSKRLLIFFTK